ncbi:unnamed protein product [Prorocentrum cordatum]|uniref:Uncharacterized protein n=1 Tax=Prorocentrum cordatum TaxID=2364126 RepID=A0ABN9TMR5_9DINO|nr:unnamed protein product [Polarella glacialis]
MDNFARRRQTELKQGLVSMVATMGSTTPEITGKLPGFLSPSKGLAFKGALNDLSAISEVPAAGSGRIVARGALCELLQDQSAGTDASAGRFDCKAPTSSDAAAKRSKLKLAAEIANPRLAITAVICVLFQDLEGAAAPLQRAQQQQEQQRDDYESDVVTAAWRQQQHPCNSDRVFQVQVGPVRAEGSRGVSSPRLLPGSQLERGSQRRPTAVTRDRLEGAPVPGLRGPADRRSRR